MYELVFIVRACIIEAKRIISTPYSLAMNYCLGMQQSVGSARACVSCWSPGNDGARVHSIMFACASAIAVTYYTHFPCGHSLV